ncbi:MAG: CBS domain-containing protein [Phycisphaerales bacterium]|nr:CBS domain-containing protein [Phycisphaerales bacterium]NNM24379.1 CBS domain-containing protein [Phycisphaerales bacterium]
MAGFARREVRVGQTLPGLEPVFDAEKRRRFVRRVLRDLRALRRMLDAGMFDDPTRRIGAEQEYVLIDGRGRPARAGLDTLTRLADESFTTELSLFNLEYNAPPVVFGGDCLRRLEQQLASALDRVRAAAAPSAASPLLTGILPTLRKHDLDDSNITPRPRYHALVKALRDLRGEDYELRINGPDELIMRHESVMLEAANTSCQFHFQVQPQEFATVFNAAQAAAGPVLAAAANAPLLFGRRLWRETRIALFQQAVDTRRPLRGVLDRSARVRFGEAWVRHSPLELFQDDIARFPAVLVGDTDEDALAVLDAGGVPRLRALQLHNGTVYRWNRACYGVTNQRPHLRIESRMLPAGPTVTDEVANAACWYGLLVGIPRRLGDMADRMDFDVARSNFLRAARLGLDAPLVWLDGRSILARDLVLAELLPLAAEGLSAAGIDADDAGRFLGIVEQRVASGQTGARWLLDGLDRLGGGGTRNQVLDDLVSVLACRQQEGRPVHEWKPATPEECTVPMSRLSRVDQLMTTDVFTVRDDDVIDLAASLMDWKHVRHVPVEDADHHLVGLISYRQLLRVLARGPGREQCIPVGDVMQRDPVTVSPETPTLEAVELMRARGIPCLPVVRDRRLVGILTERDFIPVTSRLLEEKLRSC